MTLEQLLSLLAFGVKRGASDIHLEAGFAPSYRIRGELLGAKMEKLTPEDTLAIAHHIVPPDDPFFSDNKAEIDRGFGIAGVSRFRASIFRQRAAIGLVLRVVPFDVPTLRQLNLPVVLDAITGARQGLVLVTGATGSGKTTTISAMLGHMEKSDRLHIITIEEPIEFLLNPTKSLIIQREVGADTATYGTALRSALRQDPDVLMVGEMRDRETAEICLKAGETGHLVISSLHTVDAQRTIGRFVGMFAPEEQPAARGRLADTLKAVVGLRLIVRTDGQGQIPAVEVLLSTRAIQEAIRDPAKTEDIPTLMEKARDVGMQTFDQHLVDMCRSGAITAETAMRGATRPGDIQRALMLGGGS